MNPIECQHESELVDALASGQWPEASGEELRDHVRDCRDCQDLALVAGAVLTDRREAEVAVNIRPSGATWWRMQLRVRREAAEGAARTVRRAHATIVSLTIVALVAVLAMTSLPIAGWKWLTSALPTTTELLGVWAATPITAIVLVAVAVLLLAPVAVYLAVAEE